MSCYHLKKVFIATRPLTMKSSWCKNRNILKHSVFKNSKNHNTNKTQWDLDESIPDMSKTLINRNKSCSLNLT